MSIIAVSGKIGSGKSLVTKIIRYIDYKENYCAGKTFYSEKDFKDTIFNAASLSDWEEVKFAGKLKDIVCLLVGCTRAQLEDPVFKNTPLGEMWNFTYYNIVDQEENVLERHYSIESANEFLPYWEDNVHNYPPRIVEVNQILTPRLMMQLIGTECMRNLIHPDIWCMSLMNDYVGDVEEWKPMIGYEDEYHVSSFGNVKSLERRDNQNRFCNERILTPTLSGNYFNISIRSSTETIHSLVAKHFLKKPVIDDKLVINHIDQNPQNNFYKNLEWCTYSHNIRQANLLGNGNIGIKQADAKLTEKDVLEIKKLLGSGTIKQYEIAKLYNVCSTTISDIKLGKKWNHIGKEKSILKPIVPKDFPKWIISDLRFVNEIESLLPYKPLIIRMESEIIRYADKDNFVDRLTGFDHESETGLDSYHFENVINNTSSTTISDLIVIVHELMVKNNLL